MRNFDYSLIDLNWTLFLDRDGVINRQRVGDYVKNFREFEFLPGVFEALKLVGEIFGRIVIVTNQQGVAKGLLTEEDLEEIHQNMIVQITNHGGRIDGIFYCPFSEDSNPDCRKPNIGMALQAKKRFPTIDFSRSVMIGDSHSDMKFGQRLGMHCARIGDDLKHDSFDSLLDFSKKLVFQK
ncbi:HAD family hydrolase [Akkermansiaceae bacterium]|nr:HAD family hydrolase [Akkermansiaceae bacterium]